MLTKCCLGYEKPKQIINVCLMGSINKLLTKLKSIVRLSTGYGTVVDVINMIMIRLSTIIEF